MTREGSKSEHSSKTPASEVARIVKEQDAQIGLLEWEMEERERQSGIDSLTGARKREVLVDILDQSLKMIHKEGEHRKEGISLIFIDLDRFKQVNDTYGHLEGDKVLKRVAELFKNSIRATDMLARYGGDEFVVFLPDTGEKRAAIIAEKLRTALVNDPEIKGFGVTASLGVCSSEGSTAADSERFIRHADGAAYLAKRAGGNKVEIYM